VVQQGIENREVISERTLAHVAAAVHNFVRLSDATTNRW
jgi:hypothetical protein